MFPFWSPNSRSLGFFAGTKLLRIDLAGGPPQTLCEAENGRGGAWSRNNVIVFGRNSVGLSRVPAGGGESTTLTTLEAGQTDHRFPSFTPDGSQALFYVNQPAGGGGLYVASMATAKVTKLFSSDTGAIYSRGYLLFAKGGTLLAQKFDAGSLVTDGEAFPVAEQLETGIFGGMLGFSASETGTLTYGTGVATAFAGQNAQVLIVDRQGKVLHTLGAGTYVGVDLSPDGTQVVAHRHEGGGASGGGGGDLHLLGLQGGEPVRLTFGGAENAFPGHQTASASPSSPGAAARLPFFKNPRAARATRSACSTFPETAWPL